MRTAVKSSAAVLGAVVLSRLIATLRKKAGPKPPAAAPPAAPVDAAVRPPPTSLHFTRGNDAPSPPPPLSHTPRRYTRPGLGHGPGE